MRRRTKARELALQFLYQVDIRKEDADILLEDFWLREEQANKQINSSIKEFTTTLVKGTLKNLEKIDAVISSYAEHWELKRMAVIDRNIMRMACFEMLYLEDIPSKVSINEAIELAKRYGDVDSGKFVNGILDRIIKEERKNLEGKEKRRADLHVHTTYSDSSFSPEEVLRYAKKIGLSCVGIADHDSVSGLDEAIGAGSAFGIEVVPAVEVSAEEDKKELHLLGYYIDYKDDHFKAALKNIRDDRKKRLYKMVEALNKHGLNIDADDLLRSVGEVSISRLHIANYMKAKNLVSSWREAFSKYIGDNKPCYVASFRYSSAQAIRLIKKARGIPVIAHPGLNSIDSLLPKLIEQGIEGIEAFHSEHSNSLSRHYQKYAKEHGLLVTGGSDCHGTTKGRIAMGKVTVPYSYVEELKKFRQAQ